MKRKVFTSDIFQSSDLALVALISLHYPIEAIDKTDPKKVLFVFRREDGLDDLVEAFWKGSAVVDPKRYFAMLRELKSRIYQNG